MKYLLKMAVFLLLTGCASAPQAGGLVDVSILDRTTGKQQTVYRQHGKLYIAGTPGNRYTVILRNKTAGRVLTVLSVDGVNVVSGESASPNQTGYVLAPFAQTDISGWRKSQYEVATFYFTAFPDSYAVRTGRPENVGVIGVAVYRERAMPIPRPWVAPESAVPQERRSSDAAGAMSESLAKLYRKQELGTGHGERESSPVSYTAFEHASDYPDEVIKIYYDSYQNLVARGVIPRQSPEPEPFPVPVHFVPDP